MTVQYDNVAFWNVNHSHPEYADGWQRGELCLHPDGVIFDFYNSKRSPLVIAWKNIQSTYPSIFPYPSAALQTAYWLSFICPAITALTFGQVGISVGGVSIKYKEAALDKIIVSQFFRAGLHFQKQQWINEVDSKIWQYKRQDRGFDYE